MAYRILIVDDEKALSRMVEGVLQKEGFFRIYTAADCKSAELLTAENEFQMILLDVMLPKKDGFEVCQQVREFSGVPIVMLTAKGEDMDKILGLEYGADDYITKPFNILEVKARIRAIMRRTTPACPAHAPDKHPSASTGLGQRWGSEALL